MKALHIATLGAALALALPGLTAQTVYPTGTTIWNRDETQNGFTYLTNPNGTGKLINMQGTVVHEWLDPTDPFLLSRPLPDQPGHILALNGVIQIEGYALPRASRITEYDGEGNRIWEFTHPGDETFGGLHHDVEREANGNTLVLCSRWVEVAEISPDPLIDDCILEIGPAGNIVWEWSTFEHFSEFGFSDEARMLIADRGGDWAHANSLHVLPANDHGDPALAAGNILVSYRHLNTLIIIDRATGQIVWKIGPEDNLTIGQHSASMISREFPGAGNILVFDNGSIAGYPSQFRDSSRVVEIGPALQRIVSAYTARDSGFVHWRFYSPIISGAQRLRNGNTLAVEGITGRVFEYSEDGTIVWEYMSPFQEIQGSGDNEVVSYDLYRAYRLPYRWNFTAQGGSLF